MNVGTVWAKGTAKGQKGTAANVERTKGTQGTDKKVRQKAKTVF